MTALEDIYRVLAEFPEEARAREQGAFDEIAGSRAKLVVLWGAGNLGRRLAAAMRAAGFSPLSFCDRNAQLQGSEVDGIPVISVEAAVARWGREAAFVVAIWHGAAPQGMADRIEQLQSLGCECVCSFVPLAWKLSARLLPFYACDLPSRLLENADALRALANALDDEESRRVLAAQLRWRLHGDFHGMPAPAPDQYFPRDVIRPIEEEVFVDAGAFSGDTLEAWRRFSGDQLRRYVAIEPDGLNATRLEEHISRLPEAIRSRVVISRTVLGAEAETIHFAATGTPTSTRAAAGELQEVHPLDSLECCRDATFLKVDVEGMELEVLAGARATIRRGQPVVAVAAYHQPNDLAALWKQLHADLPRHRWFLRQHERDGWELILYGLPGERCAKNNPGRINLPAAPRECPVCGSTGDRRVLHPQRFASQGQGGINGYDVVVCRQCGASFAEGIPSQEELDRYYAGQSKYTYDHAGGAESPYDFKRFEIIADRVIPFLPSHKASILDVGCATGGLLSVFKQRGFGNVLGVDPSPVCAQAARRLHGVEVRTATLAQLVGWQESFDLILLVGVLEHLRDVQPAVRTVTGRLKAGGLLYCAQPDVTAFADCVNAPYQQFSVEHVNFFSEVSLNRLMAVCGLVPRQTWRWIMEWREGVTDSVVSGNYSAPLSAEAPSPQVDHTTEPALERYLTQCRAGDEKLLSVIERLVRSQEPVLIWGAGTLSRRLLETTRLAEAKIVAFVDSNPGIQGHRLAGRDILAPAQIAGRRENIVVCSKAFEREIVRMIRDQLHFTNPVILLG